MIYGYARVSTQGQAKGNSLAYQEEQLRSAGAETIFSDVFTGSRLDRPAFEEMQNLLVTGDTVVVTKLDRFARSMQQASRIIDDLLAKGVELHVLNIGRMDSTPSGKLIRNVFLAFAEFEREIIAERTAEGKETARQRSDYREGRPYKFGRAQMEHAANLLETHSYKQVEAMTGISVSTLTRYMRNKNRK